MQDPEASPSPGSAQAGGLAAREAEALIASFRTEVEDRLEQGLHDIQATAIALMREIASEVWRTAGGDKDEVRDTIVGDLSRDEAIRGLMSLNDERFQALAARTAGLEEGVAAMAETIRGTNDRLAQGVAVLAKLGAGGASSDDAAIRSELAQVTRQIAGALESLAGRDQAIVDAVRTRIREHGELIAHETARVSAAMEGYVQHGVQALGQLAGTVEAQITAIATRDSELELRVTEAFEQQTHLLAEQLQLMYERMAIDTTSLSEGITHIGDRTEERMRAVGEYLHLVNDRVDVAARQQAAETARIVDARVMGLARMVRSDAEALRGELVRVAAEQDEAVASRLDERLGTVSDAVAATVTTIVDDLAGRMHLEMADAVRARLDEVVARLEERTDEHARRNDLRMLEVGAEMERRLATVTDSMLEVTTSVASVTQAVDGRIAALARLIRSDNETIAQQIVADQDSSKQALRAMKELQASLPNEVIEMVEQRFASLAESIERSNEMLSKRIDRMAETLGAQHGSEIQVVIDRMGDAMHALASLGRPDPPETATTTAEPRIDLE